MRIFLAGATGVVGSYLAPALVDRGHEVVGTTRTAGAGRFVAQSYTGRSARWGWR